MEGSGTGHSPLVDGPATRGQRSQPVVGRVNILCKELMQEPQGRLRLLRAYKKNAFSSCVLVCYYTYVCLAEFGPRLACVKTSYLAAGM